jgi:hypothetical protein
MSAAAATSLLEKDGRLIAILLMTIIIIINLLGKGQILSLKGQKLSHPKKLL